MEFITRIDVDQGIRFHTIKGDISIQTLMEKLEKFYHSSQFDADMNAFWDLRETDMSQVITEEIHLLMELVKKHWGISGKSRSALLVSGNLGFGLSRMYENLLSMDTSNRIMVFKDENKARQWLGLEP